MKRLIIYFHHQIKTLREFSSPDSIFADFLYLSDFDDTYTCDVYIDRHLCSVCTEIESDLRDDISTDIYYEISTNKVDIAYVNVALSAKILLPVEQPPALELKHLHVILEFNEIFPIIISSKLEYEHERK